MWYTALVIVLLVHQVPAEFAKPVYIEDVTRSSGSRIVSGWESRPGQHPHQVGLRQVTSAGAVSGCGGSIVHREWVITAAHCTAGSVTIVIRAGVTHMTRPQYIFESTEWYNHPSFNSNTPSTVQPNDISILKLIRRVTYSVYLRPIRLQPSRDAFRDYDGLQVYASGFGRTWTGGTTPETLNWVYLLSMSNSRCRSVFGSIITDNTVCAGYYNVTSQSICQGDSGGPLVHEDSDGVPYLIGVSSFVAGGNFGCHSGLPGGFIRPGPFLSWFEGITGIDFENLNEEEEEETTVAPTTTTTTLAPNTTTSAPSTTTSAPSTTTSAPNTTTSAPNTTTSAPSTTTSAPNTTSPDWWQPTTPDDETNCPPCTRPPRPSPPPTPPPPPPPPPPHPKPESEEDSDEDPELSEILKRLEVKVKVKVRFTKSKTQRDD